MSGAIREASDAAYRYSSRIARTTEFGTRVPLEYLTKPAPPN